MHILHFPPNLTSDDPWPWYMTFDFINIQKNPHCILTQVCFQSDFNFSKETQIMKTNIFHLTWPQMTLDLGKWPLTSLTYEGTPIASLTQVWLYRTSTFQRRLEWRKPNQTGTYTYIHTYIYTYIHTHIHTQTDGFAIGLLFTPQCCHTRRGVIVPLRELPFSC